ncbi:ABC transporter with duplicated ATPase domains [Chaetomidium leptoderma]|uniref:ABC transporter with duplicated ATPase domains n=1 Tax=Chaetomidium leptoderma TaxID=669021 RepID=A0AAN6ZTW1_9PEZI|nr:ABC transporter with duplicated ATPase domains [Chaetomidium leptoderma]
MEGLLRPGLGLLILAMLSAILLRSRKSKPLPPVVRETTKPRSVRLRDKKSLQHYKELYVKLHNLECHREIVPEARALLLSLLSEALQSESGAQSQSQSQSTTSILSLEKFSASNLDSFVYSELEHVTREWHQYVARRKQGQPRELFYDAAAARRWLVQRTPLKFVDGAWLGHMHKITTPFLYRRITKSAWQVLSEELGDGDLAKCHAHVYAQLLDKLDLPTPSPDSDAFIHHPGMDDVGVWRAALGQLLISLFPNDFLPEILGFNLNFEMLTIETLLAAKELREVGIDPYYFSLHITIDNADSGHTAMASRTVAEYMALVTATQGDAAAHQAWKRVQAGFVLSKNIHHHRPPDAAAAAAAACAGPNPGLNAKMADIFLSKAIASRGVHEHCPMTMGGRALSTWLEPSMLRQRGWQADFLQTLANAKPWVYKGDSGRSRLVQQLCWGGSMFGAFTDREVAVVRDWIDSQTSVVPASSEIYAAFTGRREMGDSSSFTAAPDLLPPPLAAQPPLSIQDMDVSKLQVHKVSPLWFVHSCLLESLVSVPWKVATPSGCAIVRLLRAQYGFLPEPAGVDGLDEMSRDDQVDLVDIGMEMVSRGAPGGPLPEGIEHALEMWPSPFAEKMLSASTRPMELRWMLLGLTQAFAELHDAVSSSCVLLSEASRAALGLISKRERESLEMCVGGLVEGSADLSRYRMGYQMGVREIGHCFEP